MGLSGSLFSLRGLYMFRRGIVCADAFLAHYLHNFRETRRLFSRKACCDIVLHLCHYGSGQMNH